MCASLNFTKQKFHVGSKNSIKRQQKARPCNAFTIDSIDPSLQLLVLDLLVLSGLL